MTDPKSEQPENQPELTEQDLRFTRRMIDTAIKLAAIFIVLIWCSAILRPFIMLILWGGIIAIALYPFFAKISGALGGRNKLAALIIAILGLALLVVPTINISASTIDSVQTVSESIKEGTFKVPQPTDAVKSWPLVGEKIYQIWGHASTNFEAFVVEHSDAFKSLTEALFSTIAGIGGTVLQFIISLLIAAVMLVNHEKCLYGSRLVFNRIMAENGETAIVDSVATIRSVAQGILGIAVIQALLAGIGMFVAGIPGAGVWALLVLILAIVQLPPLLVLGPIAAYYFSITTTTPATIFLIWALLVSFSDAVLKPMLLGRGIDIPMLVILLGAIGGMLLSGIIGLFVGAVVLSLGYKLTMHWLQHSTIQIEKPYSD
ncbi:AI-2E family transporter [Thalassotalea litorea]|uniref:AI-2E family transporter n=1 Tax=Thalassotalea litorea TaxID=2020715 RepID=A0A5R9IQJ5_9GAMM|nr:AI-2E family transporter [Thalassotalea litorea]TLU66753.1 AI-2E family transporter [Thalassotalea litorea]